jgi:hypothetical protein
MRTYWFEIVRRGFGRFSWIFVERDGDRLKVLATGRERRKKGKVKDEINHLRDVFVDAEVVDRTNPAEPFPLPNSSFRHVSDVVPLLVGDGWARWDDGNNASYGVRTATSLKPGRAARMARAR